MKTPLAAALIIAALFMGACSHETALAPPSGPDPLDAAAADKCGHGNPRIIPVGATPYGLSYGQWTERSWQFLAAAPNERNPALDETGAFIADAQEGPVWFLYPNYGGTHVRTGTVPVGTSLFVALVAFEASSREGHGETEEELRGMADFVISGVETLTCEIDGVPVDDVWDYRVPSAGMFSLTVPEENVFDLWGVPTPAGTYYPSVADGYYLMLAPLPPGEHEIHFTAMIPMIDYALDVTYNLTVARGHRHHHHHHCGN